MRDNARLLIALVLGGLIVSFIGASVTVAGRQNPAGTFVMAGNAVTLLNTRTGESCLSPTYADVAAPEARDRFKVCK